MSCRCGATWGGHKVEHCTVCHLSFTGTTAGDMHRTGDHAVSVGPDRRRCLSTEEMEARGMAQNGKGHWMTRPGMPQNALPVRAQIDAQPEHGGLDQRSSERGCMQYGSDVS